MDVNHVNKICINETSPLFKFILHITNNNITKINSTNNSILHNICFIFVVKLILPSRAVIVLQIKMLLNKQKNLRRILNCPNFVSGSVRAGQDCANI